MSDLSTAIGKFYAAYEAYCPGSVPRSAAVEPPFRPDPRAALRAATLRMARLRLQIAKVDIKLARIAARNLRAKVEAMTTNETPCDDCGGPIGTHRRFTGHGIPLCHECDRREFGH